MALVIPLLFSFILYRIAQFLSIYIRPSTLPRYRHGTQPWALITGASDGIGLGLAFELASHGFSLILHGRNLSKLEGVKAEILKQYPKIEIRIFVYNATDTTPFADTKLEEIIKGLHLTILVNNVGMGYETHSPQDIDSLINLNLRFPVQLTHFLRPTLIANSPSLILNMGSLSDMGMPWLSVYSGSKAFLMSWSTAIAGELSAEGKDVQVLALRIGDVNSAGNPRIEKLITPGSREMAKMCLARVGVGKRVVTGYIVHGFLRNVVLALPQRMRERILVDELKGRRAAWGKTK